MPQPQNAKAAFTLIELLTVIAIIAVLAGIIFPVFATARGKAREASCQSSLRQIGMAIQMYASDYDGLYPWAKDASDDAVPQMWRGRESVLATMSPINVALDSYVKSKQIWRCTSDTGFDELDNFGHPECDGLCSMPARPTMFEKYGASYLFRTEIAFRQQSVDNLSGWRSGPNGRWQEVGQAQVNVLFDGNGSWHGGGLLRDKKYVTLFADGHTKLLTNDQYQAAWNTRLDPADPAPRQ
jgi:general secretion pathway protein G